MRPNGRSRPRPGSRRSGFTLVELIVVLAILVVATALVLPVVGRGMQGLRVRSEAGRVAALLREARQHAVVKRRTTHVTLDRARNTVTLTVGDQDDPLRELAMPEGVELSVRSGHGAVRFSPRGLARATRWLLQGPGGKRLLITVDAVSGRVSIRPGDEA